MNFQPDHPFPESLKGHLFPQSLLVFSPGRINLIGEFTDYNLGFVLPAAVDKGAFFSLTPRQDDKIHLYSADFGEYYETTVQDLLASGKSSWPNYILGVVEQYKKAGIEIRGFNGALSGNLPIGAGLSSSAAVECAVAMALNEVSGAGLEKMQMVQMAQRAENQYVGVQCGIMDQFASMFGITGHAIKLDCRSLTYEYVPLNMDGLRMVLLDTNVKHSHGSSAYNVRRQQCEQGVAMIHANHPRVESLRDASIEMLNECVLPQDAIIYKRCKFIVEENDRVLAACAFLKKNDLLSFGKKMYASHQGLQHEFEASCAELDFLVNCVTNEEAVFGARMMGGGFGGCTINLVKENGVDALIHKTSYAYQNEMNRKLTPHVVSIGNGTTIIKHGE